MLKCISWNVNGLRACVGKDFAQAFRALDADIFCLQETKLQEGQIVVRYEGENGSATAGAHTDETTAAAAAAQAGAGKDAAAPAPAKAKVSKNAVELLLPAGYRDYWNYAEKKGYSGTAVFTRREPLSVRRGIGIEEHDHEGRVLTLEFPDFFLVTCYTPNSQDELRRLDYRMEWEDAFRAYLLALDQQKPVIACGDLNVAHEEIDIKNPKTNHHNAGFTDEERAKMSCLLASGFTDTFRHFYPDAEGIYSWWSYRFHAREKNAGWRIDYFLTSKSIDDKLRGASIHTEVYGSDHCPVELLVDL